MLKGKGTKGKNRDMGERRATHDRVHRSFARRSRDDVRHDTLGGIIGVRRAACEVIDLTEVTNPVTAEPFYGNEYRGVFHTSWPASPPVTTRHQPKLLPWEGGDKPWFGKTRSIAYA